MASKVPTDGDDKALVCYNDNNDKALKCFGELKNLLGLQKTGSMQLARILQNVREEMQFEEVQDPEVAVAVARAKASVQATYIHLRSYIIKVCSMMKYIRDEETHAIAALKRGDAKEFLEFVKEVREKADSCEQKLSELIKCTKGGGAYIKEQEKLSEKEADPGIKAKSGWLTMCIAASTTLEVSGYAVAIAGVVVAPFATPIGLGFALAGIIVAIAGRVIGSALSTMIDDEIPIAPRNKRMANFCSKTAKVLAGMKVDLQDIKTTYKSIGLGITDIESTYFKAIDGKPMTKITDSGPANRSLQCTIKEVVVICVKTMADHEPLTEAKNLHDFIKEIKVMCAQL